MFAAALLAAGLQAAAADVPPGVTSYTLSGRCLPGSVLRYPAALAAPGADVVQVACDRFAWVSTSGMVAILLANAGDRALELTGRNGQDVRIDHVTLASGRVLEAELACRTDGLTRRFSCQGGASDGPARISVRIDFQITGEAQ